MIKTKLKILTVALGSALAVTSLAATALSANANSAQVNWEGVNASGLVVTDENCPVVVENELLTFDIAEFPRNNYGAQEFLSYGASVTASYTFYNPADYTVDMRLAFPFGELPSYARFYDEQPDDTAKYDITADGREVERTVRHTFYKGYGYNNAEDLEKLCDGYKTDAFFYPEMTVAYYTVFFNSLNETDGAYFRLNISLPDGVRVTGAFSGYETTASGIALYGWTKNDYVYDLYVLGSDELPDIDCTFYKDGSLRRKTSGGFGVTRQEITDFESVAFSKRSENSPVSEVDYYNAVVDSLRYYAGNAYYYPEYSFDLTYNLMRWYEYSLTIEPEGRVVNEVTAPLYPHIDGRYSPSEYDYEYLLSPAQSWASFGKFEVKINTPYYLISGSRNEFEKTDYGYYFSAETLPEGELTFTLCSSPSPERITGSYGSLVYGISVVSIVVLIILGLRFVGLVICGIVLVITYCTRKK